MDPYRNSTNKDKCEVLSTEQQLNNLHLKIADLENMLNQHPNIMLQIRLNKLNAHVLELQEKIKTFHKYKIYKYLFYIFITFYVLKWASNT
jgi:hypothetical protein